MLKNKKLLFGVFLILLAAAFIVGRPYLDKNYSGVKEINHHIDVMGIELLMPEKEVVEKIGYKGEQAMCVSGYENNFDKLGLNIGFNVDTEKVRRITVSNSDNKIFGIHKGMTSEDAREILIEKGFTQEENSLSKFLKDNILVSIISQEGTNVDGVSIEILD